MVPLFLINSIRIYLYIYNYIIYSLNIFVANFTHETLILYFFQVTPDQIHLTKIAHMFKKLQNTPLYYLFTIGFNKNSSKPDPNSPNHFHINYNLKNTFITPVFISKP